MRVVVISSLNVSGVLQKLILALNFFFFIFSTVNLLPLIMGYSGSLSF